MRLISLLLPAVLWAVQLNGQIPVGPEPADTVSDAESADTGTALDESAQKTPWRTSYFPYLTGGSNDGPVLAFRVHHFQPAEYDARVTTNAAFTADAGITPRGGRQVTARFRAPQLWKDWRLTTLAAAVREVRFGYFGLGNETVKDDDAVNPLQPFLYRVRWARYGGKVEVTRRLRGPLQAVL